MTVFEMIEAQQKGKEDTTIWMVGEQLKDICRSDPACAQIVEQDLENKEMSIEACEKKIKAYADEVHRKTKQNVGIGPQVADRIIREFYGLPSAGVKTESAAESASGQKATEDDFLDLDAFLLG